MTIKPTTSDLYPYGMAINSRSVAAMNYRFGYNDGAEKSKEIEANGNHITTFYREGNLRNVGWWSPDPKADEMPWQSPYSLMDGNPILKNDPKGDIGETIWDIANVLMDITSLASNIAIGNYGGAAVDAAGLAVDAAATFIPFVPGGAGAAIKAYRAADKLKDIRKGASKIAKETAQQAEKKVVEKERRKAVKEAWQQEKNLVEETGRGTKKWDASQKKELLEKGKVKGQEGHHIDNVKDHPEKAGDPNNIEFVTRKEHLQKHDGNFKNKTTGPAKERTVKKP